MLNIIIERIWNYGNCFSWGSWLGFVLLGSQDGDSTWRVSPLTSLLKRVRLYELCFFISRHLLWKWKGTRSTAQVTTLWSASRIARGALIVRFKVIDTPKWSSTELEKQLEVRVLWMLIPYLISWYDQRTVRACQKTCSRIEIFPVISRSCKSFLGEPISCLIYRVTIAS